MALRDVNLVPEPVLLRRYVVRHLYAWVGAFVLLIALLASGYYFYTRGILARRGSDVSQDQVRKSLAVTIAEIQRKTVELERLAFVRQATRPGEAPQVLARLAEVMDPNLWLTDLTLEAREESGSLLQMNGLSVSNATLSTLIGRLNGDPMFKDMVLKNAVETLGVTSPEGAPTNLIHFMIEAETRTE